MALQLLKRLIFLLAACGVGVAHAGGSTWLLAGISPSGAIEASLTVNASPYQAAVETLSTLTILGEIASPKVSLARNYVLSEPFHNTENLSRQIVAGVSGGSNVLSQIDELLSSQNPKDGGFGELAGWQSTPLDTAFAVKALAAAGKANDRSVGSAVTFLTTTQNADGSWRSDQSESPVYVTALALHALHQVRNSRNVSLQIEYARNWLLAQRGNNGLWADTALSGQVLSAVIPTLTDVTPLRPSLDALTALQGSDGSFAEDAWDTAWALRALFLGSQTRTNPDEIIVHGRVIDGDSLLPLDGVSVVLGGAQSGSLTTTSDGTFIFRNLVAGNYTVTLTRTGFGTLKATMSASKGSFLELGDVKMLRDTATATTGAIRGVVTDAGTGQPLAGATVSIANGASVTTAADGSYQLNDVMPGTVSLRVTASGYRDVTADATITAGTFVVYSPVLVRVELPDPAATALSGKVVDAATSAALSGVTVTLAGPQTYTLMTGATGTFAFTAIADGDYTLTATLGGYADVTATVHVQLGVATPIGTLRMSAPVAGATTGSVRGVVTDAQNGSPIAHANVNIPGLDVATTGSDGTYVLENVPAGSIQLNAFATGYQTASATGTVVAGSTLYFSPRMDLVGDPTTVSMVGTVTDAVTGEPIPDVFVYVYQPNNRWNWTDTHGRYVLDGIMAGHVLVYVSEPGYDDIFMGFQAAAGNTIAFSPKMYRTGTSPVGASASSLKGRVVSAATGDPIASAQVHLTWTDLDGTNTAHDVTLTVGSDGTFYQNAIRAFDVSVSIVATGFDTYNTVMKLPALLDTDVGDIRLHPTDVEVLAPDLTVTAMDIGTVTSDAQTLAVSGYTTVTVQNKGTADAGPFTVLVDGGTPNGSAWSAPVSSLAVGASTQVVIPVSGVLPFRSAPLRALADSEGVVVESNKANNAHYSCENCRAAALAASSRQAKFKWKWTKAKVIVTPLVGPLLDTNGDGKVDRNDRTAVIFPAYDGSPDGGRAFIRALWGDDGSTIWENLTNAASTEASQTPALGDIDGDGKPEIVLLRYGGGMVALNGDGTTKWSSSNPPYIGRYSYNTVSLADMDGDGKSEIITRNYILNNDGSIRATLSMPYTVEHQPSVIDLDGDGRPEVLLGSYAFKADGTLLWHDTAVGGYTAAAADFNRDGKPEVVLSAPSRPGRLGMVNGQTGQKLWQVTLDWGGGTPIIFDANGDGTPEIGIATESNYRVYRADGSLLWAKSIHEPSGRTSSSVFDIQGDGLPEVFYHDQDFLRIYDGKTGAEVVKIANVSGTTLEYPVVADIDHDDHAEFLFVGNHILSNGLGLHAYEGLNDDWLPTRGLWNQHNYHLDNVGEDGQIPATEASAWATHNSYHLSKLMEHDPLESADLTVGNLRVLDHGVGQPMSLLARVGNAGLLLAKAGATVRFYAGTPETGVLLGAVALPALDLGQSMDARLDNVTGLQAGALITAVVTPKAGELDCRTDDDRHSWNLAVSDQQGSVSVATDASSYGPDADVAITVIAHNTGALSATFSVMTRIVDANGIVVAELPTENNVVLAGDGSVTVSRTWNTGEILVGDYQVVTELYAADGTLMTQATAGFRINPAAGVELASISVATDRPSYNTTDSVGIEGLAHNLADNVLLSDASIAVEMRNVGGTVVGQWSDTAADLAAGTSRSYEVSLPLTASAQGAYTVHAVLRSATGADLATADAAFIVQELLSRSVSGELQVASATLIVGQVQTCSGTVRVLGTQGVSDLPIRLATVQLAGGSATAAVATQSLTLAAGGSQAIAATFDTATYPPGDYACALQYQDGDNWQTLAYRPFVLQVPPVVLSGSVSAAAAQIHKPDTAVCTFTVNNAGGGTAQNLLVERSLLAADGSVVSLQSSTITVAGNSSQNIVQSFDTTHMAIGTYRCHLETVWNSQRAVQGEAAWELLAPVCPTPKPKPDLIDERDDQDLIVNGSFEEFGKLNHGTWGTFPSIPGWDAKYGPLEIQTAALNGIAQKDGNARLELDSENNAQITQRVSTDAGGRYELLIAYTPRVTTPGTDTNDIEVWWNGQRVKTLHGDTQGWHEERVEVTATQGLTELTLKAAGTSDQIGGLIDQVRLYCLSCRRANLLNNGSFERHPRLANDTSGYFTVIPGWRATTAEPFEVQHDAPQTINVLDGHVQIEVDGQANARAAQDVHTASGNAYGLDLFYAPRVPLPKQAPSNLVEVWWAGQLIDTLQGNKNEWYMKHYNVTANDNTSRLELRGAGTSDGFGGAIDNVQLSCQASANAQIPVIVSTPVVAAMANEPWEYELVVDHVDANALHLTLEQAPVGVTLGADHVLHWSNPVRGEYTIRVRIDDGCGGTSVQTFTLTVGWPEWCPVQ